VIELAAAEQMGHNASRLTYDSVEEEIKKRGVLIPPSFGAIHLGKGGSDGNDDGIPVSSSLVDLQLRIPDHLVPSLLSDLQGRDPSNRILSDYMRPGLWLSSSPTSSLFGGDPMAVRAGLLFTDAGGNPSGMQQLGQLEKRQQQGFMSTGLISILHSAANDRVISRLCMGVEGPAAPSLTTSLQLLPSQNHQMFVMGHASANGYGWFGTHLHLAPDGSNAGSPHDRDGRSSNISAWNLRLGSWISGKFGHSFGGSDRFHNKNKSSMKNGLSGTLASLGSLDNVGAYAAASLLGSTAAVEVQCPLGASSPPQQLRTRSYFSINLADDVTDGKNGKSSSSPPLVVSLERSIGAGGARGSADRFDFDVTSALAISQVLYLDRYQLNPMEDRAPKILNTLAWTVRMERLTSTAGRSRHPMSHDKYSESDGPDAVTRLALGGAWQINRNVAVKAVARSDSLSAAVLLRRWKEPRITCSLLFRHLHAGSSSWRPQFAGIGLDVEMGSQLSHSYADERAVPSGIGTDTPVTKATLPRTH
jgi:hypothetical protein